MYQIVCSTLLPVTSLREVNFKVHKMLVFLINFNNYQSLIPLTSLNHANVSLPLKATRCTKLSLASSPVKNLQFSLIVLLISKNIILLMLQSMSTEVQPLQVPYMKGT